jgi:glucose-1-phosphate cytidylyltransferase
MKVVILCGGKGTRLNEETEFKPKPLVSIGGKPILWHIMKSYAHQGHKEFVLLLGYKSEHIKRYFMEHTWRSNNFCYDLKTNTVTHHEAKGIEDWKIHFVETGLESQTALRLKKAQYLLENDEQFMLTYGDGVSDVNVNELIAFHNQTNSIGTITGFRPRSKYGVIDCEGHFVKKFKEKPLLNDLINGGFMIFNKEIFNHLDHRNVMLVDDTLPRLASFDKLTVRNHEGFWHCMDTYKDYKDLNKIWDSGNIPWKIWDLKPANTSHQHLSN